MRLSKPKTPPKKKQVGQAIKKTTSVSSSNSRLPNKTFSGPEVGMAGNLGGPSGGIYNKVRKKKKKRTRPMDRGTSSPAGGGSSPGAYTGGGDGNGMAQGRTVPTFNEVVKKKTGGRV